jgi:hypothetical protein
VADPAHNGHKTLGNRVHRFLVPVPKLEPPINPAPVKRDQERAEAAQNRIADKITAYLGLDAVRLHPHHLLIWRPGL